MGEVRVPEGAYYAAQTQRAIENFPISNLRFQHSFISAFGLIKLCAAKVNMQLGLLDKDKSEIIIEASREVVEGKFDDQFVLDIFQTGSGTSTNMNANEVIANRSIEIVEGRGGKTLIHPNDHVNMGQSTNDVFPTAIHLSALTTIVRELLPAMKILEGSLNRKSNEFKDVVKAGRTHLQDAVPMTLGQEFSGYCSMITHNIRRLESVKASLSELPIGGTAVGTGLNAHPSYSNRIVQEINNETGMSFKKAENFFESMQNKDATVETSGVLKTLAVSLMKIANDLRLLYSGPGTGFYEIDLPAIQPGSSIMPGKINPVIPEAVNMVAAKIIGNDVTITQAGLNGNLELNVMMPVIAYSLLESIELATNACKVFSEKCIDGITARVEACLKYAESTVALITVLAPAIGYDNAAKIAKKSMAGGKSIRELVVEEGILSKEEVSKILDLNKIVHGGRMKSDL